MYHNIPMELRALPQWVVWRYEIKNGRQTKVPYTVDGLRHAIITDPSTWGTFDEAVLASRGPTLNGIGFVLTEDDPYTGIDIDNKPENPASEEEQERHRAILDHFQSYTERSVGGAGYHIIIRGKIAGGRDRDHVGVYSSARYLTFTGDVVRNAPIADYQASLTAMVSQMPDDGSGVELQQEDGELTDAQLHEMARNAVNGAKYDALCGGDWQAMGYPSQSEADYALISILAYYTKDNAQVRRLFRYTGLGKREKAQANDAYLNRMLRKMRAKEPPPVDLAQAAANAAAIVANARTPAPTGPTLAQLAALPPPPAPVPPVAPAAPTRHNLEGQYRVATGSPYTLPPGMVGELASYFYSSSVRPVQEVALAAAIGVVAGVVGRSYNISGTGLNQYLLFVARTGTGKEDGPRAIERLFAAVRPTVPMVEEFVGPGAFASGQALIRVLDARPCFLSILGEFGLTLQALNDPRAPAAVVMLKRVLLDLYAKSGWNNVLRSTAYSDSEKNTKTIHAPNVSFLGDTTPETFYDSIGSADIADGLIPRLQIIEYTGKRPKRNKAAGQPPPPGLVSRFADLAALALTTANNNACANVQTAPDALEALDAFDEECDAHMNGTGHAVEVQLWNRAHLKALKLGALLAVGCNPHNPMVTLELAHWAIAFTRRSTEAIVQRFNVGDVGNGEAKQMVDLRRAIEEYMRADFSDVRSYKVKKEVHAAKLVPYSYLLVRAARMAAFYKDRRGTARALRETLEQCVLSEQLGAVSVQEATAKFGIRQALYFVGGSW